MIIPVKSINNIGLRLFMNSRIHHYAKEITKRLAIFAILLLFAYFFHRIFSIVNEEIIGAIILIIGFSIRAMYYYFNLFKEKDIHKMEFIISIIFVFLLTITMFAVIYSEPI